MKRKESRQGLEFESALPFPTMITVMRRAIIHSMKYKKMSNYKDKENTWGPNGIKQKSKDKTYKDIWQFRNKSAMLINNTYFTCIVNFVNKEKKQTKVLYKVWPIHLNIGTENIKKLSVSIIV